MPGPGTDSETDASQAAEWTAAFINTLDDSCFLHIESGGKKDDEGKTTPRSLRHLPYKDASGKIDLPHLRNAIARIPQMTSMDETMKARLQTRARALLAQATKAAAAPPKPGHKPDDDMEDMEDEEDMKDEKMQPMMPMGKGMMDSMRLFLGRLYDLVKGKAKDGSLTADEWDAAVRTARAHAGGKTRAEKARAAVEHGEGGDLADLCTTAGPWRLFVEVPQPIALAEPPAWIPLLPKPGKYTHPKWGEISITTARNQRFVKNFATKVYQDQVPVDAEHQTKLSGALGWITQLRENEDGSVDGKVTWTDRGEKLIEADRFKFTSAEWWDEWDDPATGQKHHDVLIGAALTTRPFFKEKSLRPLVASERGLSMVAPDADLTADTVVFFALPLVAPAAAAAPIPSLPPPAPVSLKEDTTMADTATEQLKAMSEQLAAQATALSALQAERDAAKAMSETQAAAVKAATEQLAAMHQQARRKRFSELVNGQAEGAEGARWYGATEANATLLERMAEAFGEESDTFRAHVEQQRALAEQLRQSALFGEIGRDSVDLSGSTSARATRMATERAKVDGIESGAALAKVFAEHPELYERYRQETSVRI